ncbi:Hypothetical predicted protein [Paramuricea clavata]|uniref:Uncharacterized protein n=1 Tax=Paramuricea clavata TaxID=317549 RepID=A0A6S7I555_PARCT|nr:Hypothetical predicted protein [Paramuricea clavata]
MKGYADKRRNAKESNLSEGDKERESGSEEIEISTTVPEVPPEESVLQQAKGETSSAGETSSQGGRDGRVPNGDSNQTAESVPFKSQDLCVPDVRQKDMEIML